MPLVINVLGGGYTDRQTNTHAYQCVKQSKFKKPGAHGLRAHAWFKIKLQNLVHIRYNYYHACIIVVSSDYQEMTRFVPECLLILLSIFTYTTKWHVLQRRTEIFISCDL